MMEVSISSQEKTVNLYFVRPAEGVSSPCLLAAYQACEKFQSKWISSDTCMEMSPTKKDVFICDPFEGKAFAHLTDGFKCVVVGPRCILSCLHRTEPIPRLLSPIHNTAMRDLVITATGFEKDKKDELKTLVERMAGIYSGDYHLGITHLVANEVGSKKYQVAVEQEIPIMTGEWVFAVWQAVIKDHTQHILATDEQFLSHTCPVLYGMVVCVSQLDQDTKIALKGIIEENGGTYSGMLEMSKTSILIVSAPEGEKYTYACKWRIKCVTPDWIYDSVQRGHALPMGSYEVKKQRISTPNSSQANNTIASEVPECSAIPGEGPLHRTSNVDETKDMTDTVTKEKKETFSKEVNLGLEAVESLDLQEAQRAGLFLDGCKIFLSGFSSAHLEKLRRVLNCGGATRFNKLTDSVSHMVIGKPVEEHLSLVRGWSTRPHLVYARWVTESIRLRRAADEAQFAHPLEGETVEEEVRRPQHSTSNPKIDTHCNGEVPMEEEEEDEEDEVLKQYLKPGQGQGTPTNSVVPSDSQDRRGRIFHKKTFTVSGYYQDMEETLISTIESEGGNVVSLNHPGRVHYSVVTTQGQSHPKAEEIVSHYFLEDCITSKRILAVDYYHVPLLLSGDCFPLEDCCITISTYTMNERQFLENLATLLGAQNQDQFAKKANPNKGIISSTHLVCPLPTGNKYQAAQKWGVPAVSADWLIECARTGSKVPVTNFTVGQTKRPKLARKKILREHLDAVLERRRLEEGGEQPSPRTRKNQSGSVTPSPDRLKQADGVRERLSLGCNNGGGESSMHPPNTRPSRHSIDTQKEVRDISDSFKNSSLVGPLETPSREFYKKFYEDIRNTMKKYKRKTPLEFEKSSTQLGTSIATQASQYGNVDARKDDQEVQGGNSVPRKDKMEVDGPLVGVVICSSRKLRDQWEEMAQVVEDLGGQFLHDYSEEVTHFLFQGRPNDLNREFRRAKQDQKVIVAPDWLWMCQERGMRVDEGLFPHTHNPNMSLSLVSSNRSPGSRNRVKRKYFDEEKDAEEDHSQQQQQNGAESSEEESKQRDETQQEKEKLSKQLEEIGALAQMSGNRNGSGRKKNKPLGDWGRPTKGRHVDIETQPMSGEEVESQSTAITWEDPMEREARLHLQNQLTGNVEEPMDEDENQNQKQCAEDERDDREDTRQENGEEEAQSTNNEPVASMEKADETQMLVFVLVGMLEEKREHYTKVVEELGGTITLSPMFNPDVTHLVAESLSRSERTLSAIASGKWVLHTLYLDHSQKAGHFLKEEMYAWGNPAAHDLPPLEPENTRTQLAKAAWRWRCAISGVRDTGQRPFHHIVALILSSKDRTGAFTRMIQAGGGEVVTAKPPYGDLEGITHLFAEMDKTTEKVDLEVFATRGIPCLKPIYINNYLIMDPLPDEEDHYITQYKDLLVSMSGERTSGSGVKRLRRE